ncbi:MAG: amidohydrolase [Proteobacteria bacterium]|nr:amidohydrolase [Pseudomonadota bacterium]
MPWLAMVLVAGSAVALVSARSAGAQESAIDRLSAEIEAQVIAWRRDFHQHPELSNREFRTAEVVAEALRAMDLEVETGIAHTGVVGYLRGARERPLVAIRADMDALPVTEATDLPFASTVTTEFRGQEVGVMHACGHDTHMAMQLGVASNLVALRDELPGSVLFIFQPAEEGAPAGEEGGAELMLKEGLFERYRPDVVFGMHAFSNLNTGQIGYRAGAIMASADAFELTIRGRQTHGARPWDGVDPIVVAAQIITGVQTIVSRQVDVTRAPAVVSFGAINGGIRSNIIPDEVELIGTIRNLDMETRDRVHEQLRTMVTGIAESAGAQADLEIIEMYPVTANDPALTRQMLPTIERVVGRENMIEGVPRTVAEDFSFFALEVPGLYLTLGVTPPDVDAATAPANHSPLFYVDEAALITGVRVLRHLTMDYMSGY